MGFILIDFKKKDDERRLKRMVQEKVGELDNWIDSYEPEDDTPPMEEECAELESAKIEELLGNFSDEASGLWRVVDDVPRRTRKLVYDLDKRRGDLYHRFSEDVEELQDLAAKMLNHCAYLLNQKEEEIEEAMPMKESALSAQYEDLMSELTRWINRSFPDGVDGLDAYDDDLPEGVSSFIIFKEGVLASEESMAAKNADAIAAEVEEIKEANEQVVKDRMKAAIESALASIVEDVADDAAPYLDEDDMQAMREQLIAGATEYAESLISQIEA